MNVSKKIMLSLIAGLAMGQLAIASAGRSGGGPRLRSNESPAEIAKTKVNRLIEEIKRVQGERINFVKKAAARGLPRAFDMANLEQQDLADAGLEFEVLEMLLAAEKQMNRDYRDRGISAR